MRFIYIGAIIFLLISCRERSGSEDGETRKSRQMEILAAERTGIDFENKLTESIEMNGFNYMNFNNGAGVAAADYNNDGLQDIYFLSTLGDNKLYLNKGDLRFQDISTESGTGKIAGFHTGVTTVDINSDGWNDIYICCSGPYTDPEMRRNKLLVNQGTNQSGIPVFTEESSKYGLDIDLCSTQAAFFDFDLDGDLDMFLINSNPDLEALKFENIEKNLNAESNITADRLYINQNGKYVDISEKAGLVNNSLIMGLGIGVSDLNNDGWPDVYVCSDFLGQDALYLNNRNGTFTESSHKSLYHMTYSSMGNDLADFNNDGWTDILSCEMMAEDNYTVKISAESMNSKFFQRLVDLGLHHQCRYNTLQMNNGIISKDEKPVFSDLAQISGIQSTDWSWGPLVLDLDNDGNKDLFIHNGFKADYLDNDFKSFYISSVKKLLTSREISPIGVLYNPKVFEIMMKMPKRKKNNYFFRNNGDLTFSKMNGIWADELLTCSNGAAYADFDNDGDLDIIVNNSEGISFLYKNNSRETDKTNFLDFNLRGPAQNPLGIGTKIILKQKGQIQVLEQYLTRGFESAVSPVLHFGLGYDTIVPELEVIWPDGKSQVIADIASNQVMTLYYREANRRHDFSYTKPSLFSDFTGSMKINFRHEEDPFNDFEREPLLPHKMSDLGPAMAVGDVNNDGLEDFYVGGATGHSGRLYFQTGIGFRAAELQPWSEDINCEDVKAVFFDADKDGDQDLYVVSGGNKYEEGSQELQDRLYLNDGMGNYKKSKNGIPSISESGSCVVPCDYDGDGDLDLFIGGRQKPGKYPLPVSSRIFRNDSNPARVSFSDITSGIAPGLSNIGMVTDALFTDIDGDKKPDLVVVGEWMSIRIFKNTGKTFEEITAQSGLDKETGWWNCVTAADIDKDGDIDLIAGNLGLNYRYKANKNYPFELYSKDFDNNGTLDMALGYYYNDTLFLVYGLDRVAAQNPFIKQKYPYYRDYARASLADIYGSDNLKSALHYKATNFATSYLENTGNGKFSIHPLPNQAQISSVNGIVTEDIDRDGNLDLVIAGNMYSSEVETVRNDASIGLYLKGDGKGNFAAVSYTKSGLFLDGDIRGLNLIHLGKGMERGIMVSKNNSFLQLVRINDPGSRRN